MRRIWLTFAFLSVLIAFLGGRHTPTVEALGEAILFVTGPTPSAGDLAIRDRLQQRYGYTVTLKAASLATASDATGKALVLISSTAPVADVGTKFLNVATPVAVWNPGVLANLKMTGTVSNVDFGTVAHYNEVVIANPDHAMAAGRSGIVTVTSAPVTLSWGYAPSPNMTVIATLGVNQSHNAIFGYEEGKLLANGTPAPKRRLGLFLSNDTATLFPGGPTGDSDGWALFDAAIAWAIDVNLAPTIDTTGIPNPIVVEDPRDATTIWPTIQDDDQPEPVAVAVAWSLQSGPGAPTFDPSNNERTIVSFPAPGSYVLKVAAADGLLTSQSLVPVTVQPYKQRFPESISNAITVTPSTTVQLPATVTLSITVTDRDQSVKIYQWTKIGGPQAATVTFGTPTAITTTASFPVKGTYRVQISITDTVDLPGGGTTQVTDTRAVDIVVKAAVALVVSSTTTPPNLGTISAGDVALRNRLEGLGFTTTLVRDTTLGANGNATASGKQLVVISGSVADANVAAKFRTTAVPVIVQRPTLFDDMHMTSTTLNTHFGTQATQALVEIVTPSSPLAAGLSGQPEVSKPAASLGWGVPAGSGIQVAKFLQVPPPAGARAVFGYELGATMFSSTPAARRRVGFFAVDATVPNLTREGWLLFDAAASWASGNNMAPLVDVGSDFSIEPIGGVATTTLTPFVKDDGQPAPLAAGSLVWSCLGINCTNVTFGTPQPPPGNPSTGVTFAAPGDYTLRLTVNDGDLVSFDQVEVHVRTPNSPPAVMAGNDQTASMTTATSPATATLSGSYTDDGLPNPPGRVTVAWSQVSGPGPATITNPSSLSTPVTLPTNGIYVFRLTADDGALAASDEMTITVNVPALLVVGSTTLTPADQVLLNRLTVQNYAAVTIDSASLNLTTHVTGKAVVVVAPSAVASAGITALKASAAPVVVARHDLFDDMGLTAANAFGTVPAQTRIGMVAGVALAFKPLAAGLAGTPTVAQSSTFAYATFLTTNTTVQKIANILGDTTRVTLFAYETNVSMPGQTGAHGRRAGLFLWGQGSTVLNANGGALFDAAVAWVAKANLPPRVYAGSDAAFYWSGSTLNLALSGTVTDDGLPSPPAAVLAAWSVVPPGAPGVSLTPAPGQEQSPSGSAVNATATFSAPGTYTLRLTARDGSTPTTGLTAFDELSVAVSTDPNRAPVVDAGPDQTVVLPGAAELLGSAYDDGRPSGTLSFLWSTASGPGTATFSSPASLATTATFDAAGTYRLRLTVSDGQLSTSDIVEVQTQANVLLVTQGTTLTPDEVAIKSRLESLGTWSGVATIDAASASGSSADAKSLVFLSPSVTESAVTTKFKLVSVPVITTLRTLFDDMGLTGTTSNTHYGSASSQTALVIALPSHPLGAGFAAGNRTVASSGAFAWGAGGTAAPLPAPASPVATLVSPIYRSPLFAYEKGAVMPGIAAGAPARRLAFGLLPTKLNTDGWLLFDAAVRWAASVNGPPRVYAGVDRAVTLPSSVTFSDALAVDDGSPLPLSVAWSAVAGPGGVQFTNGTTATASAAFTKAGTYLLRLTAFDGYLTRWDHVSVEVLPAPPNGPPTVNAGPDRQLQLAFGGGVFGPFTLVGQASDDGLPDPPAAVSVTWSFVRGPATPVINPTNALQTNVTFPAAGTYTLRLTASDSALSSADEVTLTVLPSSPALLVVPNASVNPLTTNDTALKNRLTSLGFTVTAVADNNASLTSLATGKALVVVSNVDAALVGTKLTNVATPVIVADADVYPAMGMADSAVPGVDYGLVTSQTQIDITNPEHPLAAGLFGRVTFTSAPATYGFAAGLSSLWQAAALLPGPGLTDPGTLFSYETGITMLAAVIAPSRRVGFPTAEATLFTADAWRLFDAAVRWASRRAVPVLFVRGAIPYSEGRIRNRLALLGYSVTIKADAQVTAADAAPTKAAVVVISRSVDSALLGTKLRDVAVPVITFDPQNFAAMGMSGPVAGDDYGTVPNQVSLTMLQPAHPLAALQSGSQLQVLTAPSGDFGWAMPGASAARVAVAVGFSYGATVFGYEEGAAMPSGLAAARRVGLYMNETTEAVFSDAGWAIVDAGIKWCADEDRDHDGLSTRDEFVYGTDPSNPDTNGDGILDGAQASTDKGGTNLDMDADGLANAAELQKGTDPFNPDTDGDGSTDGVDCYPLDPTRQTCPPNNQNDHTPPSSINLTLPTNAIFRSSVP